MEAYAALLLSTFGGTVAGPVFVRVAGARDLDAGVERTAEPTIAEENMVAAVAAAVAAAELEHVRKETFAHVAATSLSSLPPHAHSNTSVVFGTRASQMFERTPHRPRSHTRGASLAARKRENTSVAGTRSEGGENTVLAASMAAAVAPSSGVATLVVPMLTGAVAL